MAPKYTKMKPRFLNYLIAIVICFSYIRCGDEINDADHASKNFDLVKANFKNPASNSGVNCWWWWLNGNVNSAAITKDLEAMKSRNFQ